MAIITERVGNIFSAPPGSVLIHACNAQGAWGSGVAKAFKQHYPHAYTIYRTHCLHPPPNTKLSTHQTSLVGTSLLIPPSPALNKSKTSRAEQKKYNQHWIACLFTSHGYGIHRSAPDVILSHTARAVGFLRGQLGELREGKKQLREKEEGGAAIVNGNGVEDEKGQEGEEDEVGMPGECYAVRINSGKFGVPWEDTKRVLEGGGVDMVVLRPEVEEGEGIDMGVREQGKESVEGGGRGGKAGAKRKVGGEGVDGDGDGDGDGEVKGHAGLAKRRKRRGLDGWLDR